MNVYGPILGALVLNILSEFSRPIMQFEAIVFALIFIGAVLLLKSGLIRLVETLWRRISELSVRPSPKAI